VAQLAVKKLCKYVAIAMGPTISGDDCVNRYDISRVVVGWVRRYGTVPDVFLNNA
jgi:hypothetical protein